MKEVKYTGENQDLEKIIDIANEKPNVKKSTFTAFSTVLISSLAISATFLGFNIVPAETCLQLLTVGSISSIFISGFTFAKKKQELNEYNANISHLENLSQVLEEENVDVPVENIKESVSAIQNRATYETFDQKEIVTEKLVKIYKYFYLLDNEDQIAVLRQVQDITFTEENRESTFELSLLEEEDKEDLNCFAVRTLKIK